MVSEEKSFESVDGGRTDDGGFPYYKLPRRLRLRGAKDVSSKLYPTVISKQNSVDPDEVAHYEPPHLYLHCLQIQLLSFLVPLELIQRQMYTSKLFYITSRAYTDILPTSLRIVCVRARTPEFSRRLKLCP